MERNRIEFTGAVERLREVPTRSGVMMAKWFLKVGEHRFQCVAFGNLATSVLVAGEGKEIGVVGSGSINSWKTEDGVWSNDFEVTAWCIEVDGVTTSFEKGGARRPLENEESARQERQTPESRNTDKFQHRGGPF
jgi:hypothetical protein